MSFEGEGSGQGNQERSKKKVVLGFWALIGIVIGAVIVGLVISFTTVVAVKETSGVNFCSSCHSMKPMAEAYRNSVHGGYGKSGVVAACADCHLPHESTLGYLIQKAKTGIHDVIVESSGEAHKVDWHEKRENRREWVYDSGCLHCHQNLLRGTKQSKKAFTAHKAYFSEKLVVKVGHENEPAQCVDCHKYVGHYQLEKHLPAPYAEEQAEHEPAEHH